MCKISNILSKIGYLRIPFYIESGKVYQAKDLGIEMGDFWDTDRVHYHERWRNQIMVKCVNIYRSYYLFYPHPDTGDTFRISKVAWKRKLKEAKNRIPIRLIGVSTN